MAPLEQGRRVRQMGEKIAKNAQFVIAKGRLRYCRNMGGRSGRIQRIARET
jgi:hypothetical protein